MYKVSCTKFVEITISNRETKLFQPKVNWVEKLKIPSISNLTYLKRILAIWKITPVLSIPKKGFDTSFTFRETSSYEVINLMKTLSIKKACQNTDIPA